MRDGRMLHTERIVSLRTIPGFNRIPPSEVAAVANLTRERFLKKGEILAEEGKPVTSVHFIIDGHIKNMRKQCTDANIIRPVIETVIGVGYRFARSAKTP